MNSSCNRSKVEFCFGSDPSYKPEHELVFVERGSAATFKQLAWKYLFYDIHYRAVTPEGVALLQELKEVVEQIHLVASDYRDLRVTTTKNILALLESDAEIIDGRTLQFSGRPAIICGAGPSLTAALPQIRKSEALIIACGSSLQKLLRAGIRPDFAACIDPNPELDPVFEKAEVPLLFQERVGSKLFAMLQGPKIYMGSSSSFPLDHYLLKNAAIDPFFLDAGWGAATFGAACASMWGCSKITFCGVDGTSDGEQQQLDRTHSLRWLENMKESRAKVQEGEIMRQDASAAIADLTSEIKRLEECKNEPRPIFESELSCSILSELIFDPIWLIYKHIFAQKEGELATHKFFFYQRLLHIYKEILC